ncbi:head-tail connector protein [Halovulum sp. GXIMD14794]
MNLVELNTPDAASIPVRAFAEHLRLGTGFADDGAQDGVLERYLRAAISGIEARTGKVVLSRRFSWDVTRWYRDDRQGLPVGPVTEINSVTLIDGKGAETVVDPAHYRLRQDLYRPEIVAPRLPVIPSLGLARIDFTAGFGPAWSDVPADLAQAVFLLAATNYEARADHARLGSTMPFAVLSLIERFKTVRLLGDVL